ncbi:DegV family protein [Mesomycoplasma neurolyticum]|uniref:DegV family protein n=1 Tax=Mesomycoplasma neurolyticum TaxID=2120 RepID=A0A449A6E9_9BACT|nr:DegV family protein [Mesomycoplasma neurolyticum]VEU59802.1 DegV family protein [Mesomycoplasma neurolyticum]
MKIAIIIDSSTGLTKEEAQKHNLYYLPLCINIDDKEYLDGVDLVSEEVFGLINKNSKVFTSATPIGMALELIEKLKKEYDKIIIYPISHKLSSQYSNLAAAFANDEKVHVVKSNKISALIILDIIRFKNNLKNNTPLTEALQKLEENFEGDVCLVPKYNDALVRGGRLSPSAASIAKLLKIVPIIQFKEGALEKRGKGRIFHRALINTYKEVYEQNPNYKTFLIHSNNPEINDLKAKLQDISHNKIQIFKIPNVVSIHTWVEAVVLVHVNWTEDEIEEATKIFS